MRFEITGQHLIVNSNAHHATFDLRLHGVTSHAEYVRAATVLHSHMNALNGNLLAAHKPDELPEPTGPVILESSAVAAEMHETDKAVQESLAANPEDIGRLEEILRVRREGLFVKPSEPAEPQEVVCETPSIILAKESLVGARLTRDEADAKIRDVRAHPDPEVSKAVEDYISRVIETRVVFAKPSEPAKPQEVVCVTPSIILAKESQVEDAKSIIQSEGSDTVAEVVTTPEEPEPTEKDKLATAFELDCFEKVTSPETAAKLWEEYKERVSAYGDAYRKMRATSLVMAVVDHNEGLTVPEAGALIQAEIKKLNATPVAKTPEVEQTEKPAEDISTLVQKFVDACKEFEGKPNVSESEIFRLLAVTCATPLPDRKVNPTKAFAVLDGATTLHKVPLLVKAFPDMEAAKEKILGDASKTKKFSMMCAAAKIQIER